MAYVCNAVKRLTPAQRAWLCEDPLRLAAWRQEMCRRASEPTADGFRFFLRNFMSHTPASGEGRQPLDPWPFQAGPRDPEYGPDMAEALCDPEMRPIITVKPRRMGATVIYCGFLTWVCALRADTPVARCLAISRESKAAVKLLRECRQILAHLPAWLVDPDSYGYKARDPQGRPCKDTEEELGFARGSSIASLPANGAARGETARVVLWDEAARIDTGPADLPNQVAEAVLPTIEGGGQLIVSSTGQGRSGRGKVFADFWDKAHEGVSHWQTLFVRWWERPGRDQAWYDREQAVFPGGPAKFAQEYPATPDEALMGDAAGLKFNGAHIAAAEALGREYRKLLDAGELPPPKGGRLGLGIDWGDHSAGVVLYPLAGHGVYVVAEHVSEDESAEQFTNSLLATAAPYGVADRVGFDAAGKQAMRSFRTVAGRRITRVPVPFAKFKRLCLDHIELLLARTAGDDEKVRIAIDPSCKELLRQMKNIRQREDGLTEKGDDHSLDCLLAGIVDWAVAWHRIHGKD